MTVLGAKRDAKKPPPLPKLPKSADRACKTNKDCVLAVQTSCTCPTCGVHWPEVVNRKTAKRRRTVHAIADCPKPRCSPCRSFRIPALPVCVKSQCSVRARPQKK